MRNIRGRRSHANVSLIKLESSHFWIILTFIIGCPSFLSSEQICRKSSTLPKYLLKYLKGQSHEIFCTRFFHQSVHSGSIRVVHGPFFFIFLAFSQSYCTFKTNPQYFRNRGVATPRYFGYRGVATPRFPKYRGVVTFFTLILKQVYISQCQSYQSEIFTDCRSHSFLKSVKISD